MKQEDIATFTRKIAASNATGLIQVLFEIYFSYEQEALKALEDDDGKAYVLAVRQCSQVVRHLKDSLDFTYAISRELFPLYDFVERTLARAMYRKKKQDFEAAGRVMTSLSEAFAEIAAADDSEPLMQNTQEVTVGLTYGRTSLHESFGGQEENRGFWA